MGRSWGFSTRYNHADAPNIGMYCPKKLSSCIVDEDSTLHLWLSYILGPKYASQGSTIEPCISIISTHYTAMREGHRFTLALHFVYQSRAAD